MANHELKTPITSINGYAQPLMNIYNELNDEKIHVSKETIKSSIGTIAKQVAKLSRLVTELLDMSKIESDIGIMFKMMLEFKGYKALVADTAGKAMKIIDKNSDQFELIIMDMLLSGVNGTDICVELKKAEATMNIPIIMISAHPNARELCLQAGADDYVAKPFDMKDIMSRISRFTGRNHTK